MAGLANKHRGQPGFVLGNGRSLVGAPLDDLEITIACNFIARYAPSFRPTYYGTSEMSETEAPRHLEASGGMPFFCRDRLDEPWLNDEIRHWTRIHCRSSVHERLLCAGELPDMGTQHFVQGLAGTIPTFSIQLAYWLGCDPIVLLGVDADGRGHAYDPIDGGTRMHPDMQANLIAEVSALEASLGARGVMLANGSLGGRLTIPHIKLAEALGD